jgi:1-acyl-sn-glycerol-3-phosphate acyltransferase
MYYKIYNLPVLKSIFRMAKTIPIAGRHEDEALLNKAFEDIHDALEAGDLVCIFPEGRLTVDGNMRRFRDGVEKILQRRAVPVVPMALQGLWGSAFSRHQSNIFVRLLKGFKSCVGLLIGDGVDPDRASAEVLQNDVQKLFDSKL